MDSIDPNEIDWIPWKSGELVSLNELYEVSLNLGGEYIGVGSNGGGELYAVNLLSGDLYMIPFIVMSKEEAELVEMNFIEI